MSLRTQTRRWTRTAARWSVVLGGAFCGLACASMRANHPGGVGARGGESDGVVASAPRPRYEFDAADLKLLDEIEHACFLYFWNEVGTPACLAKDRMKGPVASIAAVGFQLASLPAGVERGWISRDEGAARARTVLSALLGRDDNRKWGMYLHFLDHHTAGRSGTDYHIEYSTIDTALLLAGAMVAAEYFGEDVARLAERVLAEADWKRYAVGKDGFISMAWQPADQKQPDGPGGFLEHSWWIASDEERLVYFLAAGAPSAPHAVEPAAYYRLHRTLKRHGDGPPFVVTYPGIVFTYVFSHCYIDYRSLGADQPARHGGSGPRVDWFENSRRALLTHRQRCIELGERYRTLSADRWGLSACASRDGYIVPDVQPNLRDEDNVFEGTVAPYAAGSAVMFTPKESLAALRAFRGLRDGGGRPLVWRDPAAGGYGFVDSFNLDWNYAHDDYIGIDQGPLLLAIENARSGLIWRLFMRHGAARAAVERLGLR